MSVQDLNVLTNGQNYKEGKEFNTNEVLNEPLNLINQNYAFPVILHYSGLPGVPTKKINVKLNFGKEKAVNVKVELHCLAIL